MWPAQEGKPAGDLLGGGRVRRGDASMTTSWIAGKAEGKRQAGIRDSAAQDGFAWRQAD